MNKKRNQAIGRRLAWLLTLILVMEGMLQNAGILTARAEEAGTGAAQKAIEVTRFDGYAEGAYAEWKPVAGADGYQVYVSQVAEQDSISQDEPDVKEASESGPLQGVWTRIDDELIRSYGDYIRADALGLTEGIWYLKIVAGTFDSERKQTGTVAEVIKEVTVTAHDRSGYAWVNGTASGAYKEDGSLKEDARVIYITEETKNTVKLEVAGANANPCVGLQAIMNGYKEAKESKPLAVRIIGNITDPAVLTKGDLEVETSTANAPGITIEGVGEDAVVNGWGISIKNSSNLEVRNLGFMNCDSGEGDNVSLVQGNDHIWVHNCDMFYGAAGSDDDQKKGDGALDCKSSDYVTFSYNHFWDSGKCNLLGLEEGTDKEYHITYHHNWYDHSDSRHPRVRFYTAHVYNNYYDGNSKYGIGGARGGGSIFAENNYFRNCKYPMLISMQGSDVDTGSGNFSEEDGSIIKAYGNYMEGEKRFVPYKAQDDPDTAWDDSVEFDAYVAESRDEIVPDTVKTVSASETVVFKEGCTGGNTYNNFDTADDFYDYEADPVEWVPKMVAEYAGRLGGGDFEYTFDNETADTSYAVDEKLQEALKTYTSKLEFVGGIMDASEKIYCTVTFDPGNGDAVTKETVEVNQKVTQPENPTKIPEGKVSFDSWYYGDVKWDFSNKVTGDMTLVGKWYAEGEEPEEIFHGGTPIGTEKIIHDFTQSGISSKYFAINGEMHSQSSSGQTLECDGVVYKGKGLVLNGTTEIKFSTTTQSAKLVLLIRFYSENKKIIIDGVTYKSAPGVIEAPLKSGEHIVKGSGSDYLFAMIVIPDGESYIITLDSDNGSAAKTMVLTEGYQLTEENLPTPTKEGYTFQGWVDEENKAITVPYTPAKSMTIKAKWKEGAAENQYVITIDKQDGTDPVEKEIKEGTELTEEDLPSTLTREGYTFQGWIDEENKAITVPYKPARSMTIKAKWQENVTENQYTITIDKQNGTDLVKKEIKEGTELTETDLPSTLTREGYTFQGWVDEEGKAITVPYTPTRSMTIKATWKSITNEPKVGLQVELAESNKTYVYTGSAIKPAIIVTNNGETLIEGVDYTVKYSNNVKACEWGEKGDALQDAPKNAPKITVTGKGNLTGSTFANFRIARKSIGEADDAGGTASVKAGAVTVAKNSKATPVLVYNGVKLGAKDYTYDESTPKNQKFGDASKEETETFEIVLNGTGNYTGSRKVTVNAVKKDDLKTFTVTVGKVDLTYNGESRLLPEGTVVVKDKKDKNYDLKEHTDYEIVYGSDTTNAGTVKFSVVGMGDYTGTVTKTYTIKPLKDNSKFYVDKAGIKASYDYNSAGVTLGEDLKVYFGSDAGRTKLQEGADYKVTYSNNKKVGKGKYTITFLGNFKGSKITGETFDIGAASLNASGAKVEAADKVFKNAGIYKSVPIVTINGVALKASDYKVEYYIVNADNTETLMGGRNKVTAAGTTIKVKVTGKGNYKAEDKEGVTGTYTVCDKGTKTDLSNAKVTLYEKNADGTKGNQITKFDYTGREVKPYVVVTINGQTELTPSVDYMVRYVNNKNKGKATVIITAKEGSEYVGSKTATFSIVAKNLKQTGLLDNLFNLIGKRS